MLDMGFLTLRADNTGVRGFGMGDRCSLFHMELIELILKNTFAAAKRAAKRGLPNLHINMPWPFKRMLAICNLSF